MLRMTAIACLSIIAAPALSFPCSFDTECYEAEGCDTSAFNIDVKIEEKAVVTDYGDLTIVAVKETGRLTTLFATGGDSEYLLSLTANAARLSVHSNDGPQVITYLGQCEGAF